MTDRLAEIRVELAKADAGQGSEPWGVRFLLAELDATQARLATAEARAEMFRANIQRIADGLGECGMDGIVRQDLLALAAIAETPE